MQVMQRKAIAFVSQVPRRTPDRACQFRRIYFSSRLS
jgi:hypothetical protein